MSGDDYRAAKLAVALVLGMTAIVAAVIIVALFTVL